jgi:hypothetical protein
LSDSVPTCKNSENSLSHVILDFGRLPTNIHFKYGDKEFEIVRDFLYLGIKFSRSGSFSNAKKELVNMGTKAMYELLKRGRLHNLSIQCQLELFDSMHGRANNTLRRNFILFPHNNFTPEIYHSNLNINSEGIFS